MQLLQRYISTIDTSHHFRCVFQSRSLCFCVWSPEYDHEVHLNGNVTHLLGGESPKLDFSLNVNANDKPNALLDDLELQERNLVHNAGNVTMTSATLNVTLPVQKDDTAHFHPINAFRARVIVKHIEEASAGGDPHFQTWR